MRHSLRSKTEITARKRKSVADLVTEAEILPSTQSKHHQKRAESADVGVGVSDKRRRDSSKHRRSSDYNYDDANEIRDNEHDLQETSTNTKKGIQRGKSSKGEERSRGTRNRTDDGYGYEDNDGRYGSHDYGDDDEDDDEDDDDPLMTMAARLSKELSKFRSDSSTPKSTLPNRSTSVVAGSLGELQTRIPATQRHNVDGALPIENSRRGGQDKPFIAPFPTDTSFRSLRQIQPAYDVEDRLGRSRSKEARSIRRKPASFRQDMSFASDISDVGDMDAFEDSIQTLEEELGMDMSQISAETIKTRRNDRQSREKPTNARLGRLDHSDEYDDEMEHLMNPVSIANLDAIDPLFSDESSTEFDGDELEDPQFETEVFAARPKRYRKSGRPFLRKLEPHLAGMLGEANMLFISHKFEKAIVLLSEVIRQAPQSSDAYHTLGLIYENIGEKKKAFDAYLIAAALTPRDLALWRRLSTMARELGSIQQAIFCLNRIVRLDPADLESLLTCSLLQYQNRQYKKAAEGFQTLLRAQPGDFDLMKNLAMAFHNAKHTAKAISIFKEVIKLQPQFDLDCINMLCELLMSDKQHMEVISLIRQVETKISEIPLDLIVKIGQCYLLIGKHDEADRFLSKLLVSDIVLYGDLFADAAQTYITIGMYEPALTFLDRLKESPENRQPKNMLRRAYCSKMLKNTKEAQELYEKVLEDSPGVVEASLELAALYKETGQYPKALEVLVNQMKEFERKAAIVKTKAPSKQIQGEIDLTNTLDLLRKIMEDSAMAIVPMQEWRDYDSCRVTLETARLHLQLGHEKEFIKTIGPLIRQSFCNLGVSFKRINPIAMSDPLLTGEDLNEILSSSATPDFLLDYLESEEFFELATKYIIALIRAGEYKEARKQITSLLVSIRYGSSTSKQEYLKMLRLSAAFLGKDMNHAFSTLRYICLAHPLRRCVWNFFCRLLIDVPARMPTQKFLMRLVGRLIQSQQSQSQSQMEPPIASALICTAHYFFMAGSFRQAIEKYTTAKSLVPEFEAIDMLIGACYLSMVSQKYTADRHYTVLQAISYMDSYYTKRSNRYEAAYNMARAYQEIGMSFFSIRYYMIALQLVDENSSLQETADSETEGEVLKEEKAQRLLIQRLSAHNLSLILRQSGSHELAREILDRYFVI